MRLPKHPGSGGAKRLRLQRSMTSRSRGAGCSGRGPGGQPNPALSSGSPRLGRCSARTWHSTGRGGRPDAARPEALRGRSLPGLGSRAYQRSRLIRTERRAMAPPRAAIVPGSPNTMAPPFRACRARGRALRIRTRRLGHVPQGSLPLEEAPFATVGPPKVEGLSSGGEASEPVATKPPSVPHPTRAGAPPVGPRGSSPAAGTPAACRSGRRTAREQALSRCTPGERMRLGYAARYVALCSSSR